MTTENTNRALLIILDGVGIGPNNDNSGWSLATSNIDLLLKDYPSTSIEASVKVLTCITKWAIQRVTT